MQKILALVVALMPVTATLGQEKEGKKPAKELLGLVFTEEMKAGAVPDLQIYRDVGLPEEGVKEVALVFESYFDQLTTDPVFVGAVAELFQKEFTAKELKDLVAFFKHPKAKDPKELAAFYETPLGQKTQAKLPEILKSSKGLGTEYNLKHRGVATEQVRAIMQKYNIPVGRPAPKVEDEE